MTDVLISLLQRGLETKRQTFADDDFAGEHGQGVIGRVKRRRAVSATALGGASVVGAGALALGVLNLPGVSGALGFAPSSGSVTCTTADVEQAWISLTPSEDTDAPVDFGEWGVSIHYGYGKLTIVDARSDGATSIVAVDGRPSVIEDGGEATLRQHDDGTYTIPLPDDRVVTLRVTPYQPPKDAEVVTLEYRFPAVDVAVGDSAAAPEVTCVTTTPEPSASASPTISAEPSSPTISAQPSATPDPAVSDSFGSVASPFQCGFEFAGAEPNPAAQFRDLHWVTADAAETSVRAFFQDPDEIDFNLSGDSVPIVMYDFGVGPEFDSASGVIGHQDPQGSLAGFGTTDGVQDTVQFAVGAAYILVQDGAVVATYVPDGAPSSQYIDSYDPDTGTLYGLNVDDAFTTCSGEDVASLGDTDLYAVVGWIAEDPDGVHGPLYGWSKIEPQG